MEITNLRLGTSKYVHVEEGVTSIPQSCYHVEINSVRGNGVFFAFSFVILTIPYVHRQVVVVIVYRKKLLRQ